MEKTHLNKSIYTILQSRYIVPLYQRNYAWGQKEIETLLQDIYEQYSLNSNTKYYIGSLVVLQRKNGDYEVIDGQQRLTTITLIAKILQYPNLKESSLFYDSRPEVEHFFQALYRYDNIDEITYHPKISHLYDAISYINETTLNPEEEVEYAIEALDKGQLEKFRSYFFNNVILVRVEIPEDTDVAKYFEIMNNRGEQLQKHEVLKAKLLSCLGEDRERQQLFATIWDACSQMDIHIQKLFNSTYRKDFFGKDFITYLFDGEDIRSTGEVQDEKKDTIAYILQGHTKENAKIVNQQEDDIIDDESLDSAIIDFPNFLMHVLKLEYNKEYLKKTSKDIPLNEKYLLDVYKDLEKEIKPMYFVECLLFYRTVFDRFVIKATKDDEAEDKYQWTLKKPNRYHYEAKNQDRLMYVNTYKNAKQQERLVKSLSLLQVTFRTRVYKNWLFELLSWFNNYKDLEMPAEELQGHIDVWMLNYYNQHEKLKKIGKSRPFADGTNTPHFLFNFIDYLYYLDDRASYASLTFNYRNSVEHHRPQSRNLGLGREIIDCLGNLCLVSKGHNSKMNNEEPSGKSVAYYTNNLTPKRKMMYDITKASTTETKWAKEEILAHYQ